MTRWIGVLLPLLLTATATASATTAATCPELTAGFRDQGFSGSVLVRQQGRDLCAEDVSRVTKGTHFLIGSVSKQFTAVGIFRLVEEGKLRLNDSLKADFPTLTNADRISVRMLLNHTSGIPDFTGHPEFLRLKETPFTQVAPLVTLIESLPSAFEPGTRWDYSNSNYLLLSALIEKRSGQSWGDFTQTQLLAPQQLHDTRFAIDKTPALVEGHVFDRDYQLEPLPSNAYFERGWANGAGGLESTTRDLAAWNEALFGGRILSAPLLQEFLNPSVVASPPIHYAHGLMFRQDLAQENVYFHSGGIPGFTSMNIYVPRLELSVVVLGNSYDGATTSALAWGLLRLALGEKVALPETTPEAPLTAEDLRNIPGEFEFASIGLKLSVRADAGKLYATFQGDREYKLVPEGSGVFRQRVYGLTLEFTEDAMKVVLRQSGETVEGNRRVTAAPSPGN
ncbi:MAG: beta-lactamase family protein [Bdellovibrionaceae bacterium]|nr:beta-lactamase family protein [Pseudobdellovibrionaceae bacterium]